MELVSGVELAVYGRGQTFEARERVPWRDKGGLFATYKHWGGGLWCFGGSIFNYILKSPGKRVQIQNSH